jgi:SAM-dependent methyltransferase
MKCRHCGQLTALKFLDLGFAPPSNAYLTKDQLSEPEAYFPLRLHVCAECWLVQTEDYARAAELFTADYAYFSSTSAGWVKHVDQYAADMIAQLQLSPESFVVEIACNDGCLLENFIRAGIPCLGVEPTDSTATAAEKRGVPVLRRFFGEKLGQEMANEGKQAELIAGNNVYAHVPDINDFTRGLKLLLKPGGCITLEFPHLMQLLEHNQFDTVYHEHFSYLSLYSVQRIFSEFGLRVWDVVALPTHGGSLRVFGCHDEDPRDTSTRVDAMIKLEESHHVREMMTYENFQNRVNRVKDELLTFLVDAKRNGKRVAAYGAAAKGNTLINYAGVKVDLLPFVCDAAPAKQGKYMPGSHIPILAPHALDEYKLDFLLILPWNIAAEIREAFSTLAERGTQFVTAIPRIFIA